MKEKNQTGIMPKNKILFSESCKIHYQLPFATLIRQSLQKCQGELSDTGALAIDTGLFTGRSPENRYIVKDGETEKVVNWNKFNIPLQETYFKKLNDDLVAYLDKTENVWVRECYACAHPDYRLSIRVVNETPAANLFAHNVFLRPQQHEIQKFSPDWLILHAPGFEADPRTHGTRNKHFVVISFACKTILIGGTAYTGEIKKAVFSVLNFILPSQGVLSMHCSANKNHKGETSIFFGLSGTGKTTLSSDPKRMLIGDDEHGWTDNSIFNFEGGCYAKILNLSPETEPLIYNAIKFGALVENVGFIENSTCINFRDSGITENTRASYPLHFIPNVVPQPICAVPKNIIFLTCDATGVLPAISKLSYAQAMYHYLSGYTSKVAGTEEGIKEPQLVFSPCFGAPFLPLHPGLYAQMLGDKIKQNNTSVWLVNTGWQGGGYGEGKRIAIELTRSIVNSALDGSLDNVGFQAHPVFGMLFPLTCPQVPAEILNPRNTWKSKDAYDRQTAILAQKFLDNFQPYSSQVSEEIVQASPVLISLN